MTEIKALEYNTLKVPYEVLNKKFRSSQKSIDREVSHVVSNCNEFEKLIQSEETLTADQKKIKIDEIIQKLKILKNKALEGIDNEMEVGKVAHKRIEHLQEGKTHDDEWNEKRLNRMLVEYLLRYAYYETASKLVDVANLKDLTNLDIFLVGKDIEASLKQQDSGPCLAWCHENRSRLKKLKCPLEFNIRKLEFIHLLKSGEKLEAIRYAKKNFLSSITDESQYADMEFVMGLLMFPSTSFSIAPYEHLVRDDGWEDLRLQFRDAKLLVLSIGNHGSVFTQIVQAGLSTMKTSNCYSPSTKNKDCPVCSSQLNKVALTLPIAQCTQSRLICPITKEIMDEHNPPMMLPNGRAYSQTALMTMALENNNKVTCPVTKEEFHIDQADKVFIM